MGCLVGRGMTGREGRWHALGAAGHHPIPSGIQSFTHATHPHHAPSSVLSYSSSQAGDQSEYVGSFRRVLLDAAARLGPAM